jgi:ParG
VSQIGKAKEPELKRMNLNVPVDLHNGFKATTAAQGRNMTDVLMAFIRDYVTRNSPKLKGRRK